MARVSRACAALERERVPEVDHRAYERFVAVSCEPLVELLVANYPDSGHCWSLVHVLVTASCQCTLVTARTPYSIPHWLYIKITPTMYLTKYKPSQSHTRVS